MINATNKKSCESIKNCTARVKIKVKPLKKLKKGCQISTSKEVFLS